MTRLAISVAEFCETVGIGRTKAFELIKDGAVETFKIGRRTLITMRSVEALLRGENTIFTSRTRSDEALPRDAGM